MMIDYAQVILELQTGRKDLEKLLTNKRFDLAKDKANDLIITLIDLKWWIDQQNDNHK
jgi:hypothetical protein